MLSDSVTNPTSAKYVAKFYSPKSEILTNNESSLKDSNTQPVSSNYVDKFYPRRREIEDAYMKRVDVKSGTTFAVSPLS